MTSDYAQQLGNRLRSIRQQQGLSLHGVEEKSNGRWKAVVVGSYERGDRAVTVPKLADLAEFYGVPLAELLPSSRGSASALEAVPKVTIDLDTSRRAAGTRGGSRWAATPRRSSRCAVTTTARCSRSGKKTCARSRSSTTSRWNS